MKLIIFSLFFVLLGFSSRLWSQVFYFVDNSNSIYTFDIETCESSFVVNIQGISGNFKITDITFAPDGNFYAISAGNLYSVDLLSGQSTWLGFAGSNYLPSLTSDAEGNLYMAGYGLYS